MEGSEYIDKVLFYKKSEILLRKENEFIDLNELQKPGILGILARDSSVSLYEFTPISKGKQGHFTMVPKPVVHYKGQKEPDETVLEDH